MGKSMNAKETGGFKGFLLAMLIVVLFTCAGLFILYKTYSDQQVTKNYDVAIGVVVDYREKYDPADDDEYVPPYLDDSYIYAPIVEYEVNGKLYRQYSKEYKRNPARIGSPVEVAYDPSDPNTAVVDRTKESALGYIIGSLLTLVGPIIIVAAIISKTKGNKQKFNI